MKHPDYECEDCIGMKEHGCYCMSVGAVAPGGPLADDIMVDQRGRHYDIVQEALATYDEWMLDDCYDAMSKLHEIMKRMRERISAGFSKGNDDGQG